MLKKHSIRVSHEACGGVVKVDLRMTSPPSSRRVVLVEVEIVRDHVEFPVGESAHNLIHKAEKVYRGASIADMSEHFAGGNLQGRGPPPP
jgi:hypothetical protein